MKSEDYPKNMSIKSWAEDDRPREKMLQKGRAALTDAELVAILIGSGTPSESAVDISKRILASVSNDLNKLGRLSIRDLIKFKGIGQAKAIAIASAMELGRRRRESQTNEDSKITSSKEAFDILVPFLSDLDHEEFYALLLNRNNRFIEVVKISQGGVAGTVADTKIIFKAAIDRLASSIILAHNHPSRNRKPSQADLKLTKGQVEAGKVLEVPVLDHLIIADKSYFSLADEGLM